VENETIFLFDEATCVLPYGILAAKLCGMTSGLGVTVETSVFMGAPGEDSG